MCAHGETRAPDKTERKQKMKKTLLMIMAAAAVLLTGCGGKKCHFVSQDGKLLEQGAPVVWYDAYVGKVVSLEEAEGGIRVSVKFGKKYDDQIHDGVAGRIVNDPKISPNAFVLLIGGKDSTRPVLENDVQIPESRPGNAVTEGFSAFVDWLKNSRADELKIVGGILLIIFVLIKFVSKMFKFVLFLGLLAAIGYVCVTSSVGWSGYKEKIANAKETAQEAKAWLLQHGEKLHTILETALEADD